MPGVTGPAQQPLWPGPASRRPMAPGRPKAAEGGLARSQNGIVGDGKGVAGIGFGLHLQHAYGDGKVLGKVEKGGAHPRRSAMARGAEAASTATFWRRCALVVAGGGGDVVLQH
jgi:hypothetical protein